MLYSDLMISTACDGDRRPNVTRELLTIEDCIRAHAQKVGRNDTGKSH